jgi:hypothetical protein
MFDRVSPSEGEPIGVVSSGWLRVARCSALICTIALGVGFVAEPAADNIMVALIFFGRWGSLSLALLYLLFRRGKYSLAFALGLGAATGFISLLVVASIGLARTGFPLETFRHALFILAMFSGILSPWMGEDSPQLATLGALLPLLLWLFSISSAMLGLSSIVAFQKMAHEARLTLHTAPLSQVRG